MDLVFKLELPSSCRAMLLTSADRPVLIHVPSYGLAQLQRPWPAICPTFLAGTSDSEASLTNRHEVFSLCSLLLGQPFSPPIARSPNSDGLFNSRTPDLMRKGSVKRGTDMLCIHRRISDSIRCTGIRVKQRRGTTSEW